MHDDLQRFVEAQQQVYPVALSEVGQGRKRTHWMWYIFPQLRGLGRSAMAHTYGIRDLQEARDYLAHPVLGARLEEITRAVVRSGVAPREIFGDVDYLKFVSCMTLFARASNPESVFASALGKLPGPDHQTEVLLAQAD
ncbi:DUF1810 domain-containing protein [Pseudoxanthomonas indica]|uniref:Uncharacterized protein, DUF1810 family n=1 Tax=Pseudoxanthomonas indica TaxID=428993 RepID=A0A1T5IXG6_9GAMM|nr:DUF1810 domain-containing protein [Pseudoxanthomonas indica]GGD54940.1 calpastatin [Pseudoxanthomonas indica]SKC43834.1 Uncharacterized protein, DUF1810 family [Pseudoxanthomonas indica]